MGDIDRLLKLSEDEIYAEIGSQFIGRAMVARPPDPDKLKAEGQRWYAPRKESLQRAICASDNLRKLASQDLATHEVVVAIAGTLDLSVGLLGGVPAITVSVLVVRIGLHKFCSTYWAETHS